MHMISVSMSSLSERGGGGGGGGGGDSSSMISPHTIVHAVGVVVRAGLLPDWKHKF